MAATALLGEKHIRLAVAADGDDISFSRFVKTDRGTHRGKQSSPRLPGLEHPAVQEGRTYFRKSRRAPDENLLVSGHNNVKIGRDVRVGKFAGFWLYTLSLEERATCPRACHHWQDCYGNNMPFAKRVDHTDPTFLPKLEANIARLLRVRGRRGIIVRLHALGDFYSAEYVDFWVKMLERHPRLVIFGYTAWTPDTPIGECVQELVSLFPGRAMLRVSNGKMATGATVPIVNGDDCPPGAFICPEQTGQFEACGKCGACWSTLKNVAFLAH